MAHRVNIGERSRPSRNFPRNASPARPKCPSLSDFPANAGSGFQEGGSCTPKRTWNLQDAGWCWPRAQSIAPERQTECQRVFQPPRPEIFVAIWRLLWSEIQPVPMLNGLMHRGWRAVRSWATHRACGEIRSARKLLLPPGINSAKTHPNENLKIATCGAIWRAYVKDSELQKRFTLSQIDLCS